MTCLRQSLDDYIAIRRSLGFKLDRHPRLLGQFLAHLEEAGATTLTVRLALAWAMAPQGSDPDWWRARLAVVRGFAAYLATIDPATEVPSSDLLPHRAQRATPYLLADTDIDQLMVAAETLVPSLRAATYRSVVGLMTVAGLRVGEVIRLDRQDIDFDKGSLLVRDSKWNKSRELPLHHSTLDALANYGQLRDRICPSPRQPGFFVSIRGKRLVYSDIRRTLLTLADRAGLEMASGSCRLRPHSFRHSFAVASLLGWYEEGVDVDSRLPLLSVYMGHVDPSTTYWYLSAAPELLALAADRLAVQLGELP
jgi:integrase/recombinase XerD